MSTSDHTQTVERLANLIDISFALAVKLEQSQAIDMEAGALVANALVACRFVLAKEKIPLETARRLRLLVNQASGLDAPLPAKKTSGAPAAPDLKKGPLPAGRPTVVGPPSQPTFVPRPGPRPGQAPEVQG